MNWEKDIEQLRIRWEFSTTHACWTAQANNFTQCTGFGETKANAVKDLLASMIFEINKQETVETGKKG